MPAVTPDTPLQVSKYLSEKTEELRARVRIYGEADEHAVRARHAADVAEAQAYLKAEGSIPTRENLAKVQTAELELAAVVAESYVRRVKAQLRTIEAEIDVGRTYGATVRAEFKTVGAYGIEGS